jgi:hypothetical protein
MTYQKTGIIDHGDYNAFVGTPTGTPTNTNKILQPFANSAETLYKVAAVYGVGYGNVGYGQSAYSLRNINSGNSIVSTDWVNLRNVVEACALHQNTSTSLLPAVNQLTAGNIIVAHDGITDAKNLPAMCQNIYNNRYNLVNYSVIAGPSYVRSSNWATQIYIDIYFTWPSEDAARYFFNASGQVIITMAQTAQTHPQDNYWQNILVNRVSNVTMNLTGTYSSGSINRANNSLGYYALTDSLQTSYNGYDIGTAPYSANDVYVQVRRNGYSGVNGSNGNQVQVRAVLSDQHTSIWSDYVSAGTAIYAYYLFPNTGFSFTAPSISSSGWIGG